MTSWVPKTAISRPFDRALFLLGGICLLLLLVTHGYQFSLAGPARQAGLTVEWITLALYGVSLVSRAWDEFRGLRPRRDWRIWGIEGAFTLGIILLLGRIDAAIALVLVVWIGRVGRRAVRLRRAAAFIGHLQRRPFRVMALSFVAAILLGTYFLTLPAATRDGQGAGFVNAIFTSTSATCVTGLVVVDTAKTFTLMGQLVILILIQMGGLGIVTFYTSLVLLLTGGLGITQRRIVMNLLDEESLAHLTHTLRFIFGMSALIEAVGAVLLSIRFATRASGPVEAAYQGIFHSVSAFNNAGFSVFSGNLVSWNSDVTVCLVIAGLIILGGLGFPVVAGLMAWGRGLAGRSPRMGFNAHTRLALWTTFLLLAGGTLVILFFEFDGVLEPLGVGDKVMAAFFQSVTCRTAGYNTVPLELLTPISVFTMILLMFIGASPGGTGGGIKTTTAAVTLLSARAIVRGRRDAAVFGRTIDQVNVYRALAVVVGSSAGIALIFGMLLMTENARFEVILFETLSAFGTVGLSMGLTPSLTVAGKLLLSLLMLMGRLGPLSVALAVNENPLPAKVRYPVGRVLVG